MTKSKKNKINRLSDKAIDLFLKHRNICQELEKENQIKELQDENARLKAKLDEAKEIIEELYDTIPASMADYVKETMERAKKFIKECE